MEQSRNNNAITKMAAQLNGLPKRRKLTNRPYKSACEHIHCKDYVQTSEFYKLDIAETHWIDWNNCMRGNCGITTIPNYLFNPLC